MFNIMEGALLYFRPCFKNKRTFFWFVVLVLAFIIRDDHLGVTSAVRALLLRPECYDTMNHFFRSNAYTTDTLYACWYSLVKEIAPFYRIDNRIVLVGDGVKQGKESKYMPGVMKLHQESEDSSKAEYIFGHMFGGVGVLIGALEHFVCLPLKINIQDGLQSAASWEDGSKISISSHVVQMIENGYEAAEKLGKNAFLVLDRYFLTVPALKTLDEMLKKSETLKVAIITKAKRRCKGYTEPQKKSGRGRPPKKGDKIDIWGLFDSEKNAFESATVPMYGKLEKIQYLCRDYLWGKEYYRMLRFVLVERADGTRSVLVSSDTTVKPETIVQLYAGRFKCEYQFRCLKTDIGAFSYHFWTKSLPKINKYKKTGEPDNLSKVTDPKDQKKVLAAINAIERFVHLACIAFGMIQILMLKYETSKTVQECRYLRTSKANKCSEETLRCALRREILLGLAEKPHSPITQIITSARRGLYKYRA